MAGFRVGGVDKLFIENATTSTAGLMSPADKQALTNLTTGNLYTTLTVGYINTTSTFSVIVSGDLTTTGRSVEVTAWGNMEIVGNQSAANPTLLTEDAPFGHVALFIDGVQQNGFNQDFIAQLQLNSSLWFWDTQGPVSLYGVLSNVAAGAHTFSVRGALYAPLPVSGATLQCQPVITPTTHSFALRVVEL